MQEKRIIADPNIAMDIQKRLVDPRKIKAIILTTTKDQPPIRGFQSEGSFTFSAWGGKNKTCFSILQNFANQPDMSVFVGEGSGAETRGKLVSDFAMAFIKRTKNDAYKIRAFIQPAGVPQYPSERSGPRYFHLITICFDDRIEKNEVIIIDKDEILPEYDAAGNQLIEFRVAQNSNQLSSNHQRKKWWHIWK